MKLNRVTELKLKIIINHSLYKKNIIDEQTFYIVNEKLLKLLKNTYI